MAELACEQHAPNRGYVQQPEAAVSASSADARLLEGCLRGACPLPEADVEGAAKRAGLCWVQRRGTLLTRNLIARVPPVRIPALSRQAETIGTNC